MPALSLEMTPEEMVRNYLEAMEERDLECANTFLNPEAKMIFPGGRSFSTLEELVNNSGGRYRWVRKRIEGFDVSNAEGAMVVYCHGTLYGEWPDGQAFEGIRFIDRFELSEGKIVGQFVWNDMGETLLATRGS